MVTRGGGGRLFIIFLLCSGVMLLSSAIHTRLIKSYGVINTFRLLLPEQQQHWTRGREELLVRDVVTYWAEEYTYLKRIHYTNMSAIKVTDWGTYTHGGMDMGAWSFRPASQPSSSLTSLYGDEKVMMMTTTKSIIVIRTGHQVYINWMVSPAQSSPVPSTSNPCHHRSQSAKQEEGRRLVSHTKPV